MGSGSSPILVVNKGIETVNKHGDLSWAFKKCACPKAPKSYFLSIQSNLIAASSSSAVKN